VQIVRVAVTGKDATRARVARDILRAHVEIAIEIAPDTADAYRQAGFNVFHVVPAPRLQLYSRDGDTIIPDGDDMETRLAAAVARLREAIA